MIQSALLLGDLQRLLRTLEDDLRERLAEHPELDGQVRQEHERAQSGGRTGQVYAVWRDEHLTQVAVHWLLAAVFVRFLEDNGLLPEPWLAGPGQRLAQARDRHQAFFARHPAASDRDYLLATFDEVRHLPAMDTLFDERHNPLFRLGPSADGARALIDLLRRIEPATGELRHDFSDPAWETRFLGDLYQDLSETARKRFALLQTPEFIEEFILDRTLEPAIAELGFRRVKLIDPACGSGHFVLGAFRRLLARWQAEEPGTPERELVQRALAQVYGVDLNPFAVAIARFRLLLAALRACGIRRLADAPDFKLNLAAGDSLLHGPRPGSTAGPARPLFGDDPLAHVYDTEDAEDLRRILGAKYEVVVGNPPYITPKDPALNEAYRQRFGSCHMKYSLAVPFTERFFDLAVSPPSGRSVPAGWVGMITAHSFMKREFGKKLIESFIKNWDLTHVIDTAGAYIPGHGTPTVILLGRNRFPVADNVRAAMGIRGEPPSPADPARGLVWSAILEQLDNPGSASPFISVADLPRARFHKHPWAIGGGGAADLKELIDLASEVRLGEEVESVGFASFPGTDEAFVADGGSLRRKQIPEALIKRLVLGEALRDWSVDSHLGAIVPYGKELEPLPFDSLLPWCRVLWPLRTTIGGTISFGGRSRLDSGDTWWTWYRLVPSKYRTPLSISFAFVATHNHFVLDRGGRVFNRSAPVIKLPSEAGETEHLALVGLLNSSTACFWMKQVFFNKGSTVDEKGARQRTLPFEDFWEHDGTKLQMFPLSAERPLLLASTLDRLARDRVAISPKSQLHPPLPGKSPDASNETKGSAEAARSVRVDLAGALAAAREQEAHLDQRMISLQEELDWQVYRFYGLLDEPLEHDPETVPGIALGERAFEIALARSVAAGEVETKWFERHGSTPITEIPAHWPESYRQLVERRLAVIETNPNIALIEQPEYKRRWNREPWEEREKKALREWLLDRMEAREHWFDPDPRLLSTAQLADRLRRDGDFVSVANLFRGRDDYDWTGLVTELALDEAVPSLPGWRYAASGLRKRAAWEATWELQRREDAIDARVDLSESDPQRLTKEAAKALKGREVGVIAVPPKYTTADFAKNTYWRLRGKLDVPKERFILYPGAEREADPTPVLGWAGWTHLEQARALGSAFTERRERDGWGADQLAPLLAGLVELLPWLAQWHNEPDPAHAGLRMGDFFAAFVGEEARALGFTTEALKQLRPPARAGRRGRKASK